MSRTSAYTDCRSSLSNFALLRAWMESATESTESPKQAASPESQRVRTQISVVSRCVDELLKGEGYSDFHYERAWGELALRHPDHGLMRASWLSDGVRAMMSLAADIAFRAARLNEHLGEDAARESSGIVMIDEVDLHLHPTWQQQVMGALRATFPKLQFIVTTHSPQVLSSVHNTHIRTLDPGMEGEFVAATPRVQTLGATSLDVLQGVMGTPIRAPGAHVEALAHLEALVAERRYEEATRRLEALTAELGADHAQLTTIAARVLRDRAPGLA